MSGDLSINQKNALAGRIARELDAKDNNTDNKISLSVWNEFWGNSEYKDAGGKREQDKLTELTKDQPDGEKTISIKDAFDLIMKRIFNAAKKGFTGTSWTDANDATKLSSEAETKVNEVGKKVLQEASGTTTPADVEDDGKGAVQDNDAEQVSPMTKQSIDMLSDDEKAKLNDTNVGQIVLNLDRLDGDADGWIKADVWNKFVKDKIGIANDNSDAHKINYRINLHNALRSIQSYANSAARRSGDADKTAETIAEEWSAKYEGDEAFKPMKLDGYKIAPVDEGVDNNDDDDENVTPATPNKDNALSKLANAPTDTQKAQDLSARMNALYNPDDNNSGTVTDLIKTAKEEESLEKAEEKLKEAEAKIKMMQEEIDALKKVYDQAKADYDLAKQVNETDLEDLETQLNFLNSLITTANSTLQQARDAIAAARQEIATTHKPQAEVDAAKLKAKIEASEAELKGKSGVTYEKARMINGTKQQYYKYKENGETVRAIVNQQTGEIDKLIQIDGGGVGLNGKREFITASLLEKQTGLTYIPDGFKCEVQTKDDGQPVLIFKKGGQEANKDIASYSNFRNSISKLNNDWFTDLSKLEPQQTKLGGYKLGPIQNLDKEKVSEKFKEYLEGMKQSLEEYKADPCTMSDADKIKFEQKMFDLFLLKPQIVQNEE